MGRHLIQPFLFAATFVLLLLSSPVEAQPTDDSAKVAQAEEHKRQAQAYYRAETFDKAAEEFQRAYELAPTPNLLFNIGLCHEKHGNAEEAVLHYELFVEAAPDAAKAAEARARRVKLARVLEESRHSEDTERQAVEKRQLGIAAIADGNYAVALLHLNASYEAVANPEVRFEIAEAYRLQGDLNLAETEYRRYLEEAEFGASRLAASKQLQKIEAIKQQPTMVKGPRGSLIPSIVAFSVAGLATTAALVYGSSSVSTGDALDEDLELGSPPLDTGDSRFQSGKDDALAANISFAVAGVAAATGAVLLWRALQRPMVPNTNSTVSVQPSLGPTSAGLQLGVTF